MQPESPVVRRWIGSAPYWDKHKAVIRQMFAPVSLALAEDAGIKAGDAVLDVATGPGEPALTLATMVGPTGRVCGVDPIPGMVEAAQREAVRQGIENVSFEVAFAEHLPYADATFDAVICRFGVMFFPAPLAGIQEMLRVLKPGGNLALAVWCSDDKNPFHSVLSGVVKKYVDTPEPEEDAPTAVRFGAEGKLAALMVKGGIANVSMRLLQFSIDAPLSAEDFLELRLDIADKLRASLSVLPPEKQAEVQQEMLDALREYQGGPGMSFPSEVWLVSVTK